MKCWKDLKIEKKTYRDKAQKDILQMNEEFGGIDIPFFPSSKTEHNSLSKGFGFQSALGRLVRLMHIIDYFHHV